jgi:hypothetical protein
MKITSFALPSIFVAMACSSPSPAIINADAGVGRDSATDSNIADSATALCTPAPEATYRGDTYVANAADALALGNQFRAFSQLMKDVEAGKSSATASEIRALFDVGTPSLRSATATEWSARADALIDTFADSATLTYVPSEPSPATGGKYGAYLFDRNGVDLRQTLEKTMYGATFYRRATELASQSITPAIVDRLIALFVAHPSFPDGLAATYAERRDRKNPAEPGPYLLFKSAAIRAQFAAGLGDACTAESKQAVKDMFKAWEASLFATNIFYLSDAGPKLDAADNTKWAAALHSYGEVLAFSDGFRFVPARDRVITDAQIDGILTILRTAPGTAPRAYSFALGTGDATSTFTQAISRHVSIYAFTAANIETFKTNF